MQTNNKSFDFCRANSGLVEQRILGCNKLGVELELKESEVVVTNTCNLLKLVELSSQPITGHNLISMTYMLSFLFCFKVIYTLNLILF